VLAKWHPSTLEAFRVTGLTLTERRALHCYLQPAARAWRGTSTTVGTTTDRGDAMTNRKLAWYTTMRTNFQEALASYERHMGGGTNGQPKRHIHSTCLANRCNLVGNQCPVRASRAIDYFAANDLGFPSSDGIYEEPMVVGGNHDPNEQKSPAEIIAATRSQPRDGRHVYESPLTGRTTADAMAVPVVLPPTKPRTTRTTSSPSHRPRHQ